MSPHEFALKDSPLLKGRSTGSIKSSGSQSISEEHSWRTLLPGRSRRQQLVKSTVSGLIVALEVTQTLSSAHPPLQYAIGALLEVLKAYAKSSATLEAIQTIEGQIGWLNNMLRNVMPVDPASDAYPQGLKKRLDDFARKLQDISTDLMSIQSHDLFARMLKNAEMNEKVEDCIKMLSWHIHSFLVSILSTALRRQNLTTRQVEGIITVELAVHGISEDMRQGFKQMDNRFDKVEEKLEGLANDLGTNAIPGLRYVSQARFDYARSGRSECQPKTREEILASIYAWISPNDPSLASLPPPLVSIQSHRSLLWIKASAGAGKTTLAQTVATWCADHQFLGGAFFCSREGERSDILRIVTNIAVELAHRCDDFHDALLATTKANPYIQTSQVSQQLKTLLVEPLRVVIAKGSFPKNLVIVVDALDECDDEKPVSTVLQAISLYIAELAPLKFIITSRPVETITRGFKVLEELQKKTHQLPLDTQSPELTKRDIATFLRARFAAVRDQYADVAGEPSWPSDADFDQIVHLADELFIYAATAISFIEDRKVANPRRQLETLLGRVTNDSVAVKSGPIAMYDRLDKLYREVLDLAFKDADATLQARVKRVLGTIALAQERLSPVGLAALLGDTPGAVQDVIGRLRSVLAVPSEDEEHTGVRLIHLSFADFLVSPDRCGSPYLVNPCLQHTLLALRCLETMRTLKYNICGIDTSNDCLLNSEIPDLADRVTRCLSPAVQYACRYWFRHLCHAEVGEELLLALEDFCDRHLLHWLEALSLLGCVDVAVEALQSTPLFLKSQVLRPSNVLELLSDCEQTVRAFYPVISTSFMQMYPAVMTFSPPDSHLRRRLQATNLSTRIRMVVSSEKARNTTLAVSLSGATVIYSLDFSPDGKRIALGGEYGSIQILDTYTGAQLQALEGHSKRVNVAFSPTGREILSGSADRMVKLWDVASSACLHTWVEFSGEVHTVAWSPDGVFAAAGATDGTVTLWKVSSLEKTAVLRHEDRVRDITFSPDYFVVSGSADKTCKIWDLERQVPIHTLEHTSPVYAVAASGDGSLIACGLESGEVVLWQKSSGQRLRSLPGAGEMLSMAFHLNDSLAVGYSYSPVTVWDVSRAVPLATLDNTYASGVAFSSNGAHIALAAGGPLQIQEWPLDTHWHDSGPERTTLVDTSFRSKLKRHFALHSESSLRGPTNEPPARLLSVLVSPDAQLILAVYAKKIELLSASTGERLRIIQHSAGSNHSISVWETKTGQLIGNYVGHSSIVFTVIFTRDERHILSASYDGTIRRWTLHAPVGENAQMSSEVLYKSEEDTFSSLAVSSDGRWILSCSTWRPFPPDTTSADLLVLPSKEPVSTDPSGTYCVLRLHDVTGRVLWIENERNHVVSLAFSEDCTRALAGSDEAQMFLYDLTQLIPPDESTPRPARPLAVPEHTLSAREASLLTHISFSYDGRGVITDRSYTPLPSELQPVSVQHTTTARTYPISVYLDELGWLWHVEPDANPRRICWIPLRFQTSDNWFGSSFSARGHVVALSTQEHRLAVIEWSP
ncbi:hypothetical protein BN946_scf184803.g7 [Trametes cinnabarina]|uniref:Nephrocystin 3-like N-terminal domain-containing protein n=1 Tax=Pycnoporus cinnabarinus TaxID=5643 RepID=A0A060SC31_PYCCI|nr:hypothetical protein BN946_scf184803.g7 [Trametes cinnabarina]